MKKYFLADVLTFLRVICAILILVGCFLGFSSGVILFLFAFGELTDAFDGICARKWPYPNEGRGYFWRRYIKIIEPTTDISLGLATLLFITMRVSLVAGIVLILIAMVIGFSVQIIAYGGVFKKIATATRNSLFRKNPRAATRIVLFRRNVLYVGAIAVIVLTLLWDTEVEQTAKILLTMVAVMIGIVIWVIKVDRRTEVETK